jgi:hypothetical protein
LGDGAAKTRQDLSASKVAMTQVLYPSSQVSFNVPSLSTRTLQFLTMVAGVDSGVVDARLKASPEGYIL